MGIRKIIQEEIDNFGWADEISTLSPAIYDIPNLGSGVLGRRSYKLWLGNLDRTSIFLMFDLIEDLLSDSKYVFDGFDRWRRFVGEGVMLIDTLYIKVDSEDDNTRFQFDYMGWTDNYRGTVEDCLEYDRKYYDKHTSTPI